MSASVFLNPAVEEQIACESCGYSLRGLSDSRCPECGETFNRAALVERRITHAFLFEYHPNFKSFWQTARRGLDPAGFWRGIFLTQEVKRARLWRYWGIVVLIALLPLGAQVVHCFAARWHAMNTARANAIREITVYHIQTINMPDPASPAFSIWVDRSFPVPTFWPVLYEAVFWPRLAAVDPMLILTIVYVAWPMLTLVAMRLCRRSLADDGVSLAHVERAVIYSADPVIWTSLLLIIAIVFSLVFGLYRGAESWGRSHPYLWTAHGLNWARYAFAIQLGFFLGRLIYAAKIYLRSRRAVMAVIISQAVMLAVLAIVCLTTRVMEG